MYCPCAVLALVLDVAVAKCVCVCVQPQWLRWVVISVLKMLPTLILSGRVEITLGLHCHDNLCPSVIWRFLRNTYLVFIHSSWLIATKSLGISWVIDDLLLLYSVSCPQSLKEKGASGQENQSWTVGWNFQLHPLISRVKKRARLIDQSITIGQLFIQ